MRLTLTTNLGTADAERFEVDPGDAFEGDVVDVKPAAAAELVKRGWAVEAAPAKAAPASPGKPSNA